MVKRSQLPKEIYFDEKAGSNGVHCLDYKNESSIKYIRDDVFDQQLSAERERYDQLKAKYDALVMDNATLEYNAAEAEKHLPDVIKQFVDQERERAAKLVGALKSTILIFNKLGYPKTAEFVKQTIAEYDTQTKS